MARLKMVLKLCSGVAPVLLLVGFFLLLLPHFTRVYFRRSLAHWCHERDRNMIYGTRTHKLNAKEAEKAYVHIVYNA